MQVMNQHPSIEKQLPTLTDNQQQKSFFGKFNFLTLIEKIKRDKKFLFFALILALILFFFAALLISAFFEKKSNDQKVLEQESFIMDKSRSENSLLADLFSNSDEQNFADASPQNSNEVNRVFSPTVTTAMMENHPTNAPDNTPTNSVPTSEPTNTPTIIPTPIEPPAVNLTYPTEGQYIEMNETQTLCAVDVPASNTNGLQRKHNFNNQGWTNYSSLYTICLNPKEGNNILQVQYKNGAGVESDTITRNFQFHRLTKVTYTLTAKAFKDKNCNGAKDADEEYITSNVRVQIWKLPEFSLVTEYEDSDGDINYDNQMNSNESIELELHLLGIPGYKSNPNYNYPSHNFTNSSLNWGLVEIPNVPNENVSACTN